MAAKLTECDWKVNSTRCKIKSPELHKAIADYENLGDEESHDELLDGIADIKNLALELKKSREINGNPAAAKYMAEIISAAEAEHREISAGKVKAKKAEAQAKEREQAAAKTDDGDDLEGKDSAIGKALLLAMKQLKGNEDLDYEFIVCDAKPYGVMIARKITAQHKELLTQQTGSKRFIHAGACRFRDGQLVFEPDKPAGSLTAKLHESFKHHTGKKHAILVSNEPDAVGSQDSSGIGSSGKAPLPDAINPDDVPVAAKSGAPVVPTQTPAAPTAGAKATPPAVPGAPAKGGTPSGGALAITGSVGQGGKNKPADILIVQNALNARAKAGLTADGKISPKMIEAIRNFQKAMGMAKPDGRVDVGRGTARALAGSGPLPPPPAAPKAVAAPKLGKPELAKASEVWHGMRKVVDTNIAEVKKAIKAHYAHDHPALLKEIDQNLGKLDAITDKLDHRIADSLAKAHAAKDDAARRAELKNSKAILAQYIAYVKSEPLIAHLDANPWVKIDLRKTLIDTITHTAQSIGA